MVRDVFCCMYMLGEFQLQGAPGKVSLIFAPFLLW